MSISPQLLESVCRILEDRLGHSIPFIFRGISINRALIETAINVLNDSPEKTLPQNCRNDIRERTPDGLDRRIKEYLNTDTRTANIISDVLAEIGVVEVVSVVNPETGRLIKGTRLLKEWSRGEQKEHITATKGMPIHYLRQIEPQRKKHVHSSVLDNICREDYLNNPDVNSFIMWLEERLDKPDLFKHQYYLVKARCHWHCNGLFEAYEKYWWPFNMTCPVQDKRVSGSSIVDSFNYMNILAKELRASVVEKDTKSVQKSTLAMLRWGGVQSVNQEWIIDQGDSICNYFNRVKDNLNLSNTRLGNHEDILINSGFTKLYSLLVDDFIMYDGRVGAALGLLGRLYSEENGLVKIPQSIEFSYGSGKISEGKQLAANRRDPSKGEYRLPTFNGNKYRHINDNIKASWLLKELAERTVSRFALLPHGPLLNERLTAIQSALFMIGYDVCNNRI